jgi:hypothetical protein
VNKKQPLLSWNLIHRVQAKIHTYIHTYINAQINSKDFT